MLSRRQGTIVGGAVLAVGLLVQLGIRCTVVDPGRDLGDGSGGELRLDASGVQDPRTKRWMVALHNNLGWTLHDSGRCLEAKVEFQLAEQWAERVGTPRQRELAREALRDC